MKDDNTTIEIRDQTGRTTGPLSRQEFGHRVKLVSQKLAGNPPINWTWAISMRLWRRSRLTLTSSAIGLRMTISRPAARDTARKKFPDLEQFDIRFLSEERGRRKRRKSNPGQDHARQGIYTVLRGRSDRVSSRHSPPDHQGHREGPTTAVLFHELGHAVLKDGKEGR